VIGSLNQSTEAKPPTPVTRRQFSRPARRAERGDQFMHKMPTNEPSSSHTVISNIGAKAITRSAIHSQYAAEGAVEQRTPVVRTSARSSTRRARQIIADEVVPAQQSIASLDLQPSRGSLHPHAGHASGASTRRDSPLSRKARRRGVLALEAVEVFGEAARVVALYMNHEPAVDLHARSIHVEGSLPSACRRVEVIFSTVFRLCSSSSHLS